MKHAGKKRIKKEVTVLLILVLAAVSCSMNGCSNADSAYQKILQETCETMVQTVSEPVSSSVGGEWAVIGLVQSGYELPENYLKLYLENAVDYLKKNNGKLHTATGYKYTEYSRLMLGVSAAGGDVTDAGGWDLRKKLTDMENVCRQGVNGPIWVLIAFDCGKYETPEDTDVPSSRKTTREALIGAVLDGQLADGGWDIMGESADPDMTAMALTALAPYESEEPWFSSQISPQMHEAVKLAVERGLNVLSSFQQENGGYSSWDNPSAESCAQVLVALSSLGIDCRTDTRFLSENGKSVLDAMLTYYAGDGRFCHTVGDGGNQMATEQCCYALVAYDRMQRGEGRLFDLVQ